MLLLLMLLELLVLLVACFCLCCFFAAATADATAAADAVDADQIAAHVACRGDVAILPSHVTQAGHERTSQMPCLFVQPISPALRVKTRCRQDRQTG